jgi:NACalpha-BTF3-like transcription factor
MAVEGEGGGMPVEQLSIIDSFDYDVTPMSCRRCDHPIDAKQRNRAQQQKACTPREDVQHIRIIRFIMTADEEAKQLDSVTDNVQEKELDESKAQQAMSSLGATKQGGNQVAAAISTIAVSKEDVALIVSEMEVTEEEATRVLREVAEDVSENKSLVAAALRRLVVS